MDIQIISGIFPAQAVIVDRGKIATIRNSSKWWEEMFATFFV